MKNNKKGFTLIELLVVISIIGLLSTLAVVSLSAARVRGRDVKRLADARNIQGALELYASDKGTYPIPAEQPIILSDGCIDRVTGAQAAGTTCTDVLMKIPKSQTAIAEDLYKYRTDTNGTKYALWYYVEASSNYVCATPTEVKTGLSAAPSDVDCTVATTP